MSYFASINGSVMADVPLRRISWKVAACIGKERTVVQLWSTGSSAPAAMKRTLFIIAAVFLGTAIGLGTFTFGYAGGASYLTNDPAACANCHVMQGHFDDWRHSSHRSVAVCNDCHTPPGLVPKYMVKARNGFWHSFYMTTGSFHEPIQITPGNRQVTEQACRKCHAAIVAAIDPNPHPDSADAMSCIRCHSTVGHMR